ncbi:MAG: HAMP domain-containing sensor histidine kinase [Planctomycetota bacterium]|nr:HAMP domain-containing sensor histidine kinase [Planctomycetota bacterium]
MYESFKSYLGGVPIRLIATVMVAILIPSVLVTALGLVTVFEADHFVKDFVRDGYREDLENVTEALEHEWKENLDHFKELLIDANARGAYLAAIREDPFVIDVLYSRRGELTRVEAGKPYPELLSNRQNSALLAAIRMEGVEGKDAEALMLYRPLLSHRDPTVVLGALLGAARSSRELEDSSDSIRYLDLALARFGSTVDGSGMVRKFPLLYQKFKLLKRRGQPEAAEVARTLLRTLDEEGFRVSAEVAAVYREALSEHVSSAVQAKAPAFFIDAELLKSLLVPLEKAASSVNSECLVSRLQTGERELLFLTVPTDEAAFVVHLLLDSARFLAQLDEVKDRLHLGDALLLPALPSGSLLDPQKKAGAEEFLVAKALPSPLSHLELRYFPEPGGLPVGFRSFEVLTLATFTWAVMLLVLVIMVGVFYTLRYVLRETRTARLKSDFVSFISHELKTPLAAIKMFTETLREGRVSGEEEQQECLELIERESDRLSSLIDKVLAYSKVESEQKAFQFGSCNMAEVVDEAVSLFHAHTSDRPREIKLHSVQDISNIQMDRASMIEVVLNLLSNAAKYSPSETDIIVNIRETVDEITVDVVDKGVGIPKRDHRRIFEKFFRSDDLLTREVEGTGLGLAFSRYIAKVHNGDIRVSSQPESGSVFTLQLKKTHVLAE